jgi:hypothetical protein
MNRFKCSASLFALLCLFPTVAFPGSGSITINGYAFTGDGDFAACGNWNEGLGCGLVTSGPINDPGTQAFMGPQAIYVNGFFTNNFQLPLGTLFLDRDHTHDDFSMQAWDGPSIFELRGGTFTVGRATVGKAIQSNEYRALGFGSIAPATVRLMGGTLAGSWHFVPYSSDEEDAAASRLELHRNFTWDRSVISGIPGELTLANSSITLTVGPLMEVTGTIENPGTITFADGGPGTTQILEIEGKTTLTGGGQVVMGSPGSTIRSGNGNLPDDELINVDNTIRGQGTISTPLENKGVIRAEGGQLTITNRGSFQNTVGRVEVAGDGVLKATGFRSAAISFGNLHIEEGGLIADRSQFSDLTLSGPGAFVVPTGFVEVTGEIENPGTITFAAGTSGTTQILEIEGKTTLTGGGEVVMTSPGSTIRYGNGNLPDDELINVDNIIRGQGTIRTPLVNQSVIRAEGGQLEVTGSTKFENTVGRVEVASDGILKTSGFTQSGLSFGNLYIEEGGLIADRSQFSDLTLSGLGAFVVPTGYIEATGTIENPGTITFAAGTSGTTQILEIEGKTTLTGGGEVVMTSPGSTIRYGNGNLPDDELINVDNIIRGQGTIRTPLVNQSVIRAEGGQLEVTGSTKFENTVGRVEVASDGILKTSGFTQSGLSFGNLYIEEGGLIADRSQFSDLTLSGLGAFVVPTGYIEATGTIENPGTITFAAGTSGTTQILEIEGKTTLTGGGQVVMGSPGSRILSGSGNLPNDELINVDNTIRGQGRIGVDLTNLGTIRNQGGMLQLDRTVVNDGTIRAQGGTLNLRNDLEGNGRVEVASDGVLEVNGALFKNRTVVVENGGTIDWNNRAQTTIEVVDFFGDLTQMGGTYAPGASPAQSLLDGDYTLGGGGIFELEFAGLTGGLFDQLTVTGDVFLTDGYLSVLELASFTFGAGQYFEVVDVQGSLFGEFGGLGEGALISGLSREVFITYAGGDGNDIALYTEGGLAPAPVPLPASIPAFLAALGGLAALRRKTAAA